MPCVRHIQSPCKHHPATTPLLPFSATVCHSLPFSAAAVCHTHPLFWLYVNLVTWVLKQDNLGATWTIFPPSPCPYHASQITLAFYCHKEGPLRSLKSSLSDFSEWFGCLLLLWLCINEFILFIPIAHQLQIEKTAGHLLPETATACKTQSLFSPPQRDKGKEHKQQILPQGL